MDCVRGICQDSVAKFLACWSRRSAHVGSIAKQIMSHPEGLAIARRLIAEEAEKKTGFLDLGNLGLTELPNEVFGLAHLRGLNLGAWYNLENDTIRSADNKTGSNELPDHALESLRELKLESLDVAGVAMIARTIRFAIASTSIDRVIVSTDGEDIAAIARDEGVEVFMRGETHSHDTATVDAAVRHAVDASASRASTVVILYANVPVRPSDLADRAVATLQESGADSVQSYYRVGKTHPYWMSRMDDAGRVSQFVENRIYRRQELPALFMPDGGVIAVTRASLFDVREGEPHAFFGRDRRGIETREGDVVDVDNALDLAVAESILLARPTEVAP